MLLDVPPRRMWGWGPGLSGFCGSASIQTVGIYYGNWLSQNAVRALTGSTDAAHQVMLGSGGCCAAVHILRKLRLNVTQWPYGTAALPQAPAFLRWLAESAIMAQPVIFAVYMKTESNDRFDHIVPFVGFDEVRRLVFNDLHSNSSLRVSPASFISSRALCRASLPWPERFAYCLPMDTNYGIRVHGNMDENGELLPARLSMDDWSEPDYSLEDQRHEQPSMLTATLTASGLVPGVMYTRLCFNNVLTLPTHGFFSSSGTAERTDFMATCTVHSWRVRFASNSTTFFRVVRSTAARGAR